MPALLADRLDAARRRQFVGRDIELALFRDAITTDTLTFCVLYIYGPGGIGKTTLLRHYLELCQQTDVRATYLDACEIEPGPDAFVLALRRALDLDAAATLASALGPGRQVMLIDTYERLMPIDGWLRDQFLRQLPDQVLTVVAGRQPQRWPGGPTPGGTP